jgi:hypothetical protein
MLRYQELHDNDGVVLWFCFLTHFAGTTTENLIVDYSQLTETKLQLSNFKNDMETKVVVGNVDVGCSAATVERLCSLQDFAPADMENRQKQDTITV